MHPAFIIARRELAIALRGPLPIAVAVVAVLGVAQVALGSRDVFTAGVASVRVPMRALAAMWLLVGPALTARALADERRSGSLEGLRALPVTSASIVRGKWLAAVAIIATVCIAVSGYGAALARLADLDIGVWLASAVGVCAVGALAAAVGIAASAWTRSSSLAWVVATAICVTPWLLDAVWPSSGVGFSQVVEPWFRGRVDLSSVVVLGGLTALSLQVGVLGLERERLS